MKLEDLQSSVRALSTEDLEELLRNIRHNRTTENVIAKKEKVNKTKKDELQKLLSKLSPDQIKLLLGEA
jgi:hypothetical protein